MLRTHLFPCLVAPLLLVAGAEILSGQLRGGPAWGVLQRRLGTYSKGEAIRVKLAFVSLPPGAVSPAGWLKDWAGDALNGITGHLDEYSRVYAEAWKGYAFEARGAMPDGTGWPLEQSSYWLDGAVRLAWILGDEPLKQKVRKRLDRVVAGVLDGGASFIYWRPQSSVEDQFNSWAHSHMGRALVAYYQATGDPRVLEALVKVYRNFPLPPLRSTFYEVSGAVNLDAMLDTYAMSGDGGVLARAVEYAGTAAYQDIAAAWRTGHIEPGHNVIFLENIRVPGLLYPWTGELDDLKATESAIAWQEEHYMQPFGVSSGEEYHAGTGATRNTETCDVAAFTWTYLSMLRTTGESGYADRIEKAFFNAGPAPVARDFKKMSYYQSPNIYGAGNPREEPHNPGPGSYGFTPIGHSVLCCVGNLNRVIPNYVMHMWMATLDGGLAATLYGPSAVRTTVAGDVGINIKEATAYPFQESIVLTVHPEKDVVFPLYLRVPAWCHEPRISVNGAPVPVASRTKGFVVLARKWRDGDKVAVNLPMEVEIARGRETPYSRIEYFAARSIAKDDSVNSPWASIYYGPLLFAVPIRDQNPNQEAIGACYQYALDVTPREARGASVIRRPMPSKWTWALESPLQILVKMREFDWQPTETEPLPKRPVRGGKPAEVSLVPYGCTKFRVSMLPVTEHAWEGAE
jgi:hypothetical protein